MIPTILVILLITGVGISVLAYRNRSARGIESGITSFRRELRALAPEERDRPRTPRRMVDPPRTSGVGVLRSQPQPEPDPEADPREADPEQDQDPDPDPDEGR